MAIQRPEPTTDARILSPEEGRAFFDETSRELLGISGEEFLRRWDAGEYEDLEDIPENWNILHMMLLMPTGRL